MNKKDYENMQKNIDTILQNGFTVEYIHGALTAVLCAPEAIQPSEWLPALTMKDGEEVEFKSQEDASTIMNSLLTLYNEIAHALADNEYYPLYSHAKKTGESQLEADVDTARPWCNGFLGGLSLWNIDPVADLKVREMLTPLFVIVDRSILLDDNPQFPEEIIEKLEKASVSEVVGAVSDLHKYYRLKTQPDKVKVGRNEPCPCGSGKKYKKCCGA